jgi:hypothetical protein
MLRSLKDLQHYEIGATDGVVGHVRDFYFDDDAWVIRYLVVDTGHWLPGREVLISPISLLRPDWAGRRLPVSITKAQVEGSPGIDTHLPVSRQHEMQYLGYYGYPYYWAGGGLWGAGLYPYAMTPGSVSIGPDSVQQEIAIDQYEKVERAAHRNDDPHLRSCKAVVGYRIHATDGDIGHVESMLVDDETWAIRYLVVNTSNWWIGHKVLIAPEWSTGSDWELESVAVRLSRRSIQDAPSYDAASPLTREQEALLYRHHGHAGYWQDSDLAESQG